MKFGALYLAGILWLFPIVLLFLIWADRKRREALRRFAAGNILPAINTEYSARRKKIKTSLYLTALLLVLVAFLRPQWGFTWQEVKRQGLDLMIALDTSKSMLAEDVLPNRLERSKLAIKDLVKKLTGDRLGLIAFSGTAFLQCPLTMDYNGFLLSLDDVSVDTIPVGGTSLSYAVNTALKSYEGGKKKNKILIIITDGEDLEGGVDRAIERARAEGVRIFTVGIGTTEGELIPVRDERGKITFLKDVDGTVVKTRLDEDVLQEMALRTDGMYVRSTGAEFGLDLIYDRVLSGLEKEELKSRMEKRYHERFQFPLVLALLILLIEPLVGDKGKSRL